MSVIKGIFCCSVCFLLFCGELFAQRGDGSLYSSYGLGLLEQDNYGQAARLSGSGVAARSPYFLNPINPANATSISAYTFMVDAEVDYKLMNIQTSSEEININSTNLSLVSLWFRTSRKSALSLGIMPMSSVDYSFMEKTYFAGSSSPFDKSISAYGNINKVFANFAYDVLPGLSLGLRPYYAFGQINHETFYDTEEVTEGMVSSFLMNDRDNYNGYGADLGLQLRLYKRNEKQLNFGLSYQLPATLKKQTSSFAYLGVRDSLLYETSQNEGIKHPGSSIKGGLAYQDSKWLLAADYAYKMFSSDWQDYTNSHRLSIGAEYLPDFYSFKFLEKMNFSAGLFYDTGYIKSKGTPVAAKGGSLGLGVPLHGFTRLHLSYHYEQKGSTDQLSKEVTHGISLNFNLADIWFQKNVYK
ncbi:membrane protein [Echinicola sediminis]